uniref:Actin-like ATPase domain-containing protein n=1 Tax=Amphimedon queenslandica TaxID=400682 RepID=A0A1X7SDP2_AMPQE
DITSHVEVNGGVVVENIPIGNAWGGTQVNEAFSKLLQEIVNDPEFEKFLAIKDRSQSQSKAVLNGIIYREFEEQKLLFGQGKAEEEITINLPRPFAEFFDVVLEAGTREMQGVEYEDDTLYINRAVVVSKLFGPALDGILECTLKALEGNDYEVDTFYLVGGFGGCKYVHEKISPAIKEVYSAKGRQCTVLVPPDPHLAVATGAVMWRRNPDIVKARRSDATYGIGISSVFDPNLHDEHYKYYDEEDEQHRCKNIFCIFLEKGELIKADEAITIDLVPFKQSNTQSLIAIYSTPNLGVKYIEDKNGTETVSKIGQLLIDIPNP